jgi:membrane protein
VSIDCGVATAAANGMSSTIDSMSGEPEVQPPADAEPAAHDAPSPSRVQRATDSVKHRAESIRDDLERRRADVPVIDIVFRGAEHDARTGGGILAGAVAFRVFLFVIPYVFVVVFAFGVGADAAHKDPVELARKGGIVGLASSAIQASSEASTFARVVTLSFATWALVSGARTLVKSLYTVHALIWDAPRAKNRHLFGKALLAIVAVTGVMVLVRLVAAVEHFSIVLWIVSMSVLVIVPGSLWLWLSTRVFPSAPGTTWRDMLPGSVLFGIGVQVLHLVTVVWIARSLESKSETYGALGAALTILLWAYLLGRLITASASLNTVIWRDRTQPPPT